MSYPKDTLPVEKEKRMEASHSGSDSGDNVDKRQLSDSTHRVCDNSIIMSVIRLQCLSVIDIFS